MNTHPTPRIAQVLGASGETGEVVLRCADGGAAEPIFQRQDDATGKVWIDVDENEFNRVGTIYRRIVYYYPPAALSQSVQPQAGPDMHPATADLVSRFSAALADKLSCAEKKYGYSNGWLSPDWLDECRAKLLEHIAKGDPRDVAAYCAFLWHHGEKTGTARELDPEVFLDRGLADVQDESGINSYYSKAAVLECIAYALAATQPNAAPGDGDAQLMKFYGVSTQSELMAAQAHHIEKLQSKLQPTPSLAPQRVREG